MEGAKAGVQSSTEERSRYAQAMPLMEGLYDRIDGDSTTLAFSDPDDVVRYLLDSGRTPDTFRGADISAEPLRVRVALALHAVVVKARGGPEALP